MFGLRIQFLRRFFRRIMKPMTIEEAEAKKAFLAKGYFLFSALALSAVIYNVQRGKLEWLEAEGLVPEEETKLSPGFQYARMLGVEKATVIRIKGFEVLNKKEYERDSFDITKHIEDEEINSETLGPEKSFIKMKN